MQQIYRRAPMRKCDFNKVSKQVCIFLEYLLPRTHLEDCFWVENICAWYLSLSEHWAYLNVKVLLLGVLYINSVTSCLKLFSISLILVYFLFISFLFDGSQKFNLVFNSLIFSFIFRFLKFAVNKFSTSRMIIGWCLYAFTNFCLPACLTDWLADWLTDWLTNWLIDCLPDWLADFLAG